MIVMPLAGPYYLEYTRVGTLIHLHTFKYTHTTITLHTSKQKYTSSSVVYIVNHTLSSNLTKQMPIQSHPFSDIMYTNYYQTGFARGEERHKKTRRRGEREGPPSHLLSFVFVFGFIAKDE